MVATRSSTTTLGGEETVKTSTACLNDRKIDFRTRLTERKKIRFPSTRMVVLKAHSVVREGKHTMAQTTPIIYLGAVTDPMIGATLAWTTGHHRCSNRPGRTTPFSKTRSTRPAPSMGTAFHEWAVSKGHQKQKRVHKVPARRWQTEL